MPKRNSEPLTLTIQDLLHNGGGYHLTDNGLHFRDPRPDSRRIDGGSVHSYLTDSRNNTLIHDKNNYVSPEAARDSNHLLHRTDV